MFTVYVLHSPTGNKIHIGYTADIEKELLFHNSLAIDSLTVNYRPWDLFFFEEYENESDAKLRKEELKTEEGVEYIWSLIRNRPQIIRD